jgi:membrane-associated protein
MLDALLDGLAASPWAYGVLFLLVLLDVLFPPAPGEIALVTAGVLAASGELSLGIVLPAAAAGALVGDQVAYAIGRSLRRYRRGRLLGRAERRLPQAEAELAGRSVAAIVLGRFIPFGRTAVTLSSGILRLPWARFVLLDAFAALVWASQGALLGYFGGSAFQSPLVGVLVGLAPALTIACVIEVGRRRRRRGARRNRQALPVASSVAAPACTSPNS